MADSARIEELKRRVLMDPASIAFAALAEEYRRAGQYEDAIATCRAGLQRHPAYLSARVTLGRALLELGRYDEARTELELVLRTAPENLAAIRGLAEIHHRIGDLPETEMEAPTLPPVAAPVAPAPPLAPPPPVPVAPAPAVAVTTAPVPVTPVPVVAPPTAPVQATPPPAPAPAPVVVAPSPAPVPVSVSAPSAPAPTVTGVRPESSRSAAPAVAPLRRPHPDEAALPALEAFLAAVVAVRSSAR